MLLLNILSVWKKVYVFTSAFYHFVAFIVIIIWTFLSEIKPDWLIDCKTLLTHSIRWSSFVTLLFCNQRVFTCAFGHWSLLHYYNGVSSFHIPSLLCLLLSIIHSCALIFILWGHLLMQIGTVTYAYTNCSWLLYGNDFGSGTDLISLLFLFFFLGDLLKSHTFNMAAMT